jgi:hemin uptake protein HemP
MKDVLPPITSSRSSSRAGEAADAATQGARRRVGSEVLLDGRRELIIEHRGQEYRLRHTQNDKLILTK